MKIYENFQSVLTFNLIDLCEYTNGLYNTVKILNDLRNKCSHFTVQEFKHGISKTNLLYDPKITSDIYDDEYSIEPNDNQTILIKNGTYVSYGYLKDTKSNGGLNIVFTFYDIDIDNDDILAIGNAHKYNI